MSLNLKNLKTTKLCIPSLPLFFFLVASTTESRSKSKTFFYSFTSLKASSNFRKILVQRYIRDATTMM